MVKKNKSNTAESRIIKRFPTAVVGESAKEVEERIVKNAGDFETIDYVYVLSKDGVLKGVVSIKKIGLNPNPMIIIKDNRWKVMGIFIPRILFLRKWSDKYDLLINLRKNAGTTDSKRGQI